MSILYLLLLILDIVAIIDVVKSGKSGTTKLLWVLAILFFPLAGLICWYIFGKK